jgi:hypothetical protein
LQGGRVAEPTHRLGQAGPSDVEVDAGGLQVGVTEHLLHVVKRPPGFDQPQSRLVPKVVETHLGAPRRHRPHRHVPPRQESVNGERRAFALLRPVADATAQDRVRDTILEAYAAFGQEVAKAS